MADEERDVTEKPEDADVDASEEEEGVTDQDGDRADPEPEEPDWKRKYDDLHALHLASKDKIEAANSWKSELDTLKESIQESLASGRTKDVDPTAEKLAKIRKFAEDGDVVAQDNLELSERSLAESFC